MKKIVMITLCCFLMLGIGGCSKEEVMPPSKVTTSFLDAFKKKDAAKIKEYTQWENYDVSSLSIQEEDYIAEVDKELQKTVYEMMLDFDYQDVKETIDGDKASVALTMLVYDFEPVVKQGMEEATKKAAEMSAQKTVSDKDAQAEITRIVFENVKNAKKTKELNLTINLEKLKGKWIITNNNTDIQNALLTNAESLRNIGN